MTVKIFSTGAILSAMVMLVGCGGGDGDMEDNSDKQVPASYLASGQVIFDGYDTVGGISTDRAWIKISPTVLGAHRGLVCEIDPNNGSFGSNCVINNNEADIRAAFADPSATFTYGVFRDSSEPFGFWGCDEDYFGGSGNANFTLTEINSDPIVIDVGTYEPRTCP